MEMEASPQHRETITIMPRTILFVLAVMVVAAIALKVIAWVAPSHTMVIRGTKIVTEIVRTEAARSRGLGGRIVLPSNHGMVFLFTEKQVANFWMKDMVIPIDIVWIDDGRIVGITENIAAPAFDTLESALPRFISPAPVSAVLEVNAGSVQQFGWAVGDAVTMD